MNQPISNTTLPIDTPNKDEVNIEVIKNKDESNQQKNYELIM
jgi:hypothetical protein